MKELPNLIGQRFGKLVVEAQEETANGNRRWRCKCDCGKLHISTTGNLRSGHTTDCGCVKSPDLTGRVFGKLTVLGRSDTYGSRGQRKTRLWECQCECGAITYKATDTLTNSDVSMCKKCAEAYASAAARANAGFVEGTQITKIKNIQTNSNNISGVRGVYLEKKTGKYRARLKFQGKIYNLGSFVNLEDAIKARKRGEEEIYGKFLEVRCDT